MSSKIKDWPWKWIGLGVALIGLIVASRFLPLNEWTKNFSDWIKSKGAIGYVIFVAAYVVGTVLFFPASLMTIAAGIIFGLGIGIAVALSSATLGASLAFLIGRYLARDTVEKHLGKNEKFQAVNDAIGEQGWKIVGLLRLSPLVPFNVSNYFFGVTKVKFWQYVLASFVGMAPGTALYVYLGYAGKAALDGGKNEHSPAQYVFLGVGLLATIAVTVYVSHLAKIKLKKAKDGK